MKLPGEIQFYVDYQGFYPGYPILDLIRAQKHSASNPTLKEKNVVGLYGRINWLWTHINFNLSRLRLV